VVLSPADGAAAAVGHRQPDSHRQVCGFGLTVA
jgi:hypothetical protein